MSSQALDYWANFRSEHPQVDEARLYEVFHFGDSEQLASELAELVLAGRKRATASALWTYEAEGRRAPRPGDMSVVTTWSGQPLCIIETLGAEIHPFMAVDAQFAFDEGEGDGSLASWRLGHAGYFERECARLGRPFARDMPVVCERFRLVDVLAGER
ncbi:MAG: ASCH domain-containing protein [Proteobacteria bacterium]|nr:ASCH domain-containing protein [Pseudomonadota bacterium]